MACKRSFPWLLLCLICILCAPPLASAGPAKEAVDALKSLEARVGSGISYSEYGPALTEVSFLVRAFLDSPDAGGSPDLAAALNSTLQDYEAARDVWSEEYAGPGLPDTVTDGYYRTAFSRCLYEYKSAPAGSRIFFSDETRYSIGIFDCLSRIWKKASEDLFIASGILSRMERARTEKEEAFSRLGTEAASNFEKKVAEMEATKKEIGTVRADNEKLKEEISGLKQESERLKKENEELKAKRAALPKKRNKKKKK